MNPTFGDMPRIRIHHRWLRGGTKSEHDLDAAVDCFAKLFRDLPDLRVELLGSIADAQRIWMEWRMSGTRGRQPRVPEEVQELPPDPGRQFARPATRALILSAFQRLTDAYARYPHTEHARRLRT